jgi:hypothetical protein
LNSADQAELALPPEPDPRAPHDVWAQYAVSRGMDAGDARGLTRDQLRAALAPARPGVSGVPDLERHERDPEALAARGAGRS